MKFTDSQEKAISEKGKNILVSAAAGSGKTTVLCERIKRGILAEEYDLSEIIVVSFNTESASDIRAKLLKNLSRAYEETGSIRLFRQIMNIDRAQISTIHSFALKLIKENSERLGLPAKIRNIDENEGEILKNEIMDRVIDRMYKEDAEFIELSDMLTSDRDDGFASMFLKLYDKLMNEPEGVKLIKNRAEKIGKLTFENFNSSLWGSKLLENRTEALEFYRSALVEKAQSYEDTSKAYEVFGRRFYEMGKIAAALLETKTEDDFAAVLRDSVYPDFKGARGNDLKGDNYDYYKGVFDEFRDGIKKGTITSEYSKDGFEADIENTMKFADVTYRVLECFESEYSAEKKRRGLIDYTDMERMAHRLLLDENGEKTDIARAYTKRFKAVYVDEYQDTNRVQDDIFRAISDGNLFIVGDIKQSIYGFRGACPEIFSKYRKEGFPSGGEKIFLSENFRSDENIVRFSNAIFSRLMPADPSVGYVREDDLKHSKVPKEGETVKNEKVEIHLFENKKNTVDEDGNEAEKTYSDEALYVASRIKNEISNGKYKPSDIAILVRSGGDKLAELIGALRSFDIPISTNEKEDYYKKPHVLMLLCLLNFTENPNRDIYTAGALHSEVFRFTTDELVTLKRRAEGVSLWDSLMECIENSTGEIPRDIHEKALSAYDFMNEHKALEKSMGLSEVVRRIIDDSNIVNIYTQGRSQSQSTNIRGDIYKIYSEAVSCEERYGMGLSGFVRYLEKLAGMGKSEKSSKGDENSVKILTIHGSKGLEFKLCFLYNIDKGMNVGTDDLGNFKKSPYEYEPDFGAVLPVSGEKGILHESSVYRAVKAKRQRTVKEEEMRLFYVALTRAEEKLVLTGKCTEKKASQLSERPVGKALSAHEVFSAKSFLEWLLLCLEEIPEDAYEKSFNTLPISFEDKTEAEGMTASEDLPFERLEVLKKEYPFSDRLGIPAKLTVSKLHPSILDNTEESEITTGDEEFLLPEFMEDSQISTGARRGSATHLFMQFFDFEKVMRDGVENEIERLKLKAYISPDIAKDIDCTGIEVFLSSELFKKIRSSKRIYREQRFNIKLSASEFTEDEERKNHLCDEEVFVQGVIDCVFEDENGKIVLVDYKTDSFSRNTSRKQIEEILKDRYKDQLGYYKKAVEKMLGNAPDKVLIYSFAISDTINM